MLNCFLLWLMRWRRIIKSNYHFEICRQWEECTRRVPRICFCDKNYRWDISKYHFDNFAKSGPISWKSTRSRIWLQHQCTVMMLVSKRRYVEAPLVVYTHCSSHCLNLVLAHASSVTPVRNMLDKLKETPVFFNSPSYEHYSHIQSPWHKWKSVLDLCKTRWAECHKADQHFYQAYTYIVKCLEVIAYGLHKDEGFDDDLAKNGNKDRNSKARASSLLSSLCDFQFIITFVTVYKLLFRLQALTVLLQKEATDIVNAVSMIDA